MVELKEENDVINAYDADVAGEEEDDKTRVNSSINRE
jgi:hypothetical protein